jgi:hypothetical protein
MSHQPQKRQSMGSTTRRVPACTNPEHQAVLNCNMKGMADQVCHLKCILKKEKKKMQTNKINKISSD